MSSEMFIMVENDLTDLDGVQGRGSKVEGMKQSRYDLWCWDEITAQLLIHFIYLLFIATSLFCIFITVNLAFGPV